MELMKTTHLEVGMSEAKLQGIECSIMLLTATSEQIGQPLPLPADVILTILVGGLIWGRADESAAPGALHL